MMSVCQKRNIRISEVPFVLAAVSFCSLFRVAIRIYLGFAQLVFTSFTFYIGTTDSSIIISTQRRSLRLLIVYP